MRRLVIPEMKKQGFGHIVNITSTSGLEPREGLSGYGATKSVVINMSQSMAQELRESGIKVQCVSPGGTQSNLFRTSPEWNKPGLMKAEYVAERIIFGMKGREHHIIIRRPK